MIAMNLHVEESAYDKIISLLKTLPKKDVQIITQKTIEEIDPTSLPQDDFDYMSEAYLNEIDEEIAKAKETGLHHLQSYEAFKNEL